MKKLFAGIVVLLSALFTCLPVSAAQPVPLTGQSVDRGMWVILLIAAVCLIVFLLLVGIFKKKKEDDDEENE